MKKIYLVIVVLFVTISVQAQTKVKKSVLESIPEMEMDKEYTRDDIIAARKSTDITFPIEVLLVEDVDAFAKITLDNYIIVLHSSGKSIFAYTFSKKGKIIDSEYLFSADNNKCYIKRVKTSLKFKEYKDGKFKLSLCIFKLDKLGKKTSFLK